MRLLHLALLCTGLLLHHGAGAQGTDTMTSPQARAWLRAHGIDPLPDNVPQQILSGNADALDALIAAGVDINKKTSLPQSPLELASMSCSGGRTPPAVTVRMVGSLIKAGADVNSPGMAGLTPLMIAVQECTPAVLKRLLAAGANRDARMPQGLTPLSMALLVKNYGAAEVLIDAGARISVEGGRKLTEGSDDQMLKDLVKRATEVPG